MQSAGLDEASVSQVARSEDMVARAPEEPSPLAHEFDRSAAAATPSQDELHLALNLASLSAGVEDHRSVSVMRLLAAPELSIHNVAEAQAANSATGSAQNLQPPGESGAQFSPAELPERGKSSTAPALCTPSPKLQAQDWSAQSPAHSSNVHRDVFAHSRDEMERMQRAVEALKLELEKSEVRIYKQKQKQSPTSSYP
jgi:hypothetical protein